MSRIAKYTTYGPVDFSRMAGQVLGEKVRSLAFYPHPTRRCYSVQNVISKHRIKRYVTRSVDSPDFIDYIVAQGIDVVISIACPELFGKVLLHAPRRGCINYHTSLLPKYRGRQPLFWALLHGEQEVGMTVHEMDEDFDTGPILVQEMVPVDPHDTLHALYVKTVDRGPQVLAKAIEHLVNGDQGKLASESAQATYFSLPSREHVKLFRRRGHRFL